MTITLSAPYSAMTVANYIIYYTKKNNLEMNNLKLQKILYFLQGLYLINKRELLFFDAIEKWQYGPVVPEVYHAFKDYRSNSIKSIQPEVIVSGGEDSPAIEYKVFVEDDINAYDRDFMDTVVEALSKFSAFQLVDVTHRHSGWLRDERRIMRGERHIRYTEAELLEDFSVATE